MSQSLHIRVQAIIFHNPKKALLKTIEYMHNAFLHTQKQGNLISRCVFALGDASDSPVFTDEEILALNEKYAPMEVSYRYFGFNSGFGKGQNLLAENQDCDYLLVINPDILVLPDFFTKILSPFSNEKVGLVEARQTPIEHQKSYSPDTFETEWSSLACAMIPYPIWKKLDGIDYESFFMYCEDVDLSWRIRLMGYTLYYQAQAPVYHAKRLSATGNWIASEAEVYYSTQSALMMAYKWSNDQLTNQLLEQFRAGDDTLKKIAEEFEAKRAAGLLPKQLDPEHKVSRFLNGYYTENRFIL